MFTSTGDIGYVYKYNTYRKCLEVQQTLRQIAPNIDFKKVD